MKSGILKFRIDDILKQSKVHEKPQFIGFLTQEEHSEALILLKGQRNVMFFGGYCEAERVFLGVFPEYLPKGEEYFPLEAITFKFRDKDKLSHRDFLGAVLALGIRREAVGDILIENGRAVMFISRDVCELVLNELCLVGRVGVTLSRGISGELPERTRKEELSFTVASMRLDCVVAAICGVSRNTADELIASSSVSVNSVITEKNTRIISDNDKITVRRMGKFFVKEIGGTTKKGRIKLIIEKYV